MGNGQTKEYEKLEEESDESKKEPDESKEESCKLEKVIETVNISDIHVMAKA